MENGRFAFFEFPPKGLGATYGVHCSENRFKISDFATLLSVWPKFSGRRGCPPPTILLITKLG